MRTKKQYKRKMIKLPLFIILCYSLIQIFIWFYQTEKSKQEFINLEKEVVTDVEDTTVKKEPEKENRRIDFDKLLSINSDVKGWLIIEKLNISYPIMQSENNEYYLKKNIYKENSISGSLFLDYRNNAFQDDNTIIYGHNMKNGTMFGKLDNIKNGKLGTDIAILIYTENKIYKYKVFSTYEINPRDFKINEKITDLIEKSEIDFKKNIDTSSKYLTLYTCTNTSIKRIIVHAVLEEIVVL